MINTEDIRVLLILILASILVGCSLSSSKSRLTPSPPIEEYMLRDLTYKFNQDEVPLNDGKLSVGKLTTDLDYIIAELRLSALGDLNGDRNGDAVVVISANYGGSGTFKFLIPVINHNGQAVPLDTSIHLGDRVDIKSLEISEGIITVQLLIHIDSNIQGEHDGRCCPSKLVEQRYSLAGKALVWISGDIDPYGSKEPGVITY